MIIGLILALFRLYYFLIIANIILSWVPVNQNSSWIDMIHRLTDPYLDIFRRFVPAVGKVDFSPIIALFALNLIEKILLSVLAATGMH